MIFVLISADSVTTKKVTSGLETMVPGTTKKVTSGPGTMAPGTVCQSSWSSWSNTDTPTSGNGDIEVGIIFLLKNAFVSNFYEIKVGCYCHIYSNVFLVISSFD